VRHRVKQGVAGDRLGCCRVASAQSIAAPSLDYDYYKVKVQPIFMARSLPASNHRATISGFVSRRSDVAAQGARLGTTRDICAKPCRIPFRRDI
jgi:hypothetical protein